VTTEAASRTPAGEGGFRLLAEHLPNLILLAFDAELLIWAATGAALRGECRRLPEAQRVVRFIGTDQDITALGAGGSPEVDDLLWQVTRDPSTEVTSLLVEDGLETALREEAKSACNRAALVACEVTSELDGRLDPVVEQVVMRERVEALGGRFRVATAPGQGTVVEAKLPLTVPTEGSGP
jgi:hypothetical protein